MYSECTWRSEEISFIKETVQVTINNLCISLASGQERPGIFKPFV